MPRMLKCKLIAFIFLEFYLNFTLIFLCIQFLYPQHNHVIIFWASSIFYTLLGAVGGKKRTRFVLNIVKLTYG